MPASIVSNRDMTFTSLFWKELFRLQDTHLNMSSAYHLQTDGQTKVINRCLEVYLRCFIGDWPKDWMHWLPWAEWWYNTTYHSTTHLTPFEAVYGIPPPKLLSYVPGTTKVNAVE